MKVNARCVSCDKVVEVELGGWFPFVRCPICYKAAHYTYWVNRIEEKEEGVRTGERE